MKITDVLIAYDEDWPTLHLRSIRTAYGKTAFAQEVLAGFEPILANQHTTLWSLNQSCLTYVTLLLKGQWPYQITTEYKTSEDSKTFDLRSGIPCGTSVFLEKKFPEYGQVLRIHKTHLPNLSILDALCHLGPQTYDYLVGYAQQLYKKS